MMALFFSGTYRAIIRFSGQEIIMQILLVTSVGSFCFYSLSLLIPKIFLPFTIIVISPILSFFSLICSRLLYRWVIRTHIFEKSEACRIPVAIYGAGVSGIELLDSLLYQNTYQVIVFIDDNPTLEGRRIRNIPIISQSSLIKSISSLDLKWIFIAIPSISNTQKRKILQTLRSLKVGVKILPTVDQLLHSTVAYTSLQQVEVVDLLGREEILPDLSLLKQDIQGKTILVTGAGGSIGSELCCEILKHQPTKLILLEQHEHSLYQIEKVLRPNIAGCLLVTALNSILNTQLVSNLLAEYSVDTIYHAAAFKHVPLVEINTLSGLTNNVFGTKSILDACQFHMPQSFVFVSTDKAVRPTNIMGASKRISELLIQNASKQFPECRFTMVRFGNVLDSSGSVIPLFRDQLRLRQALTVTHPEVTRYFMSIGEAVRLVIQAGAMAKGGEVFLLDMGKPVKIAELARQMIELSGYIPDRDIQILYTGLRPGEKLYEELLIEPDRVTPTSHSRIFRAEEPFVENEFLVSNINLLSQAISNNDQHMALDVVRTLVPEYRSFQEEIP